MDMVFWRRGGLEYFFFKEDNLSDIVIYLSYIIL
jgi:hypothetical protein